MGAYGTLEVIAEIGVAFAGFTGLIVALRRRSGPLTDIERYRVRILLFLAFGALFLSLLPGLFAALRMDATGVLLAAVVAALLFEAGFLPWLLRATVPVARAAPELFHWAVFGALVAGHVAASVLLSVSLASDALLSREGAFLVTLAWLLLHAAIQFVRMLFVRPAGD